MQAKIAKKSLPKGFDLQGHRGCRGLFPENTLQAFQRALELQVTTLEMDLVISKDKKVVVSHEPYFNHLFTLTPSGSEIKEDEEKGFNIFQMNYGEVKTFDVGTKIHPNFLQQIKTPAHKPLLEEIIELAEKQKYVYPVSPVFYNLEIKSFPGGDHIFHPSIEEYCDIVIDLIKKYHISERVFIQSFDLRTLQYLFEKYPYQKLSLLIENDLDPDFNIRILGFVPEVYSPDYRLVDEHLVNYCKDLNMKLIPWTVNDVSVAEKLINLGVDGLITDYPDMFE